MAFVNARSAASEGLAGVFMKGAPDGGISPVCTRCRIFSQSARCSTIEVPLRRLLTFKPPEAKRSLWHWAQVPVNRGETDFAKSSGLCPLVRKGVHRTKHAARTARSILVFFMLLFLRAEVPG